MIAPAPAVSVSVSVFAVVPVSVERKSIWPPALSSATSPVSVVALLNVIASAVVVMSPAVEMPAAPVRATKPFELMSPAASITRPWPDALLSFAISVTAPVPAVATMFPSSAIESVVTEMSPVVAVSVFENVVVPDPASCSKSDVENVESIPTLLADTI